jgi:hypothetical protein
VQIERPVDLIRFIRIDKGWTGRGTWWRRLLLNVLRAKTLRGELATGFGLRNRSSDILAEVLLGMVNITTPTSKSETYRDMLSLFKPTGVLVLTDREGWIDIRRIGHCFFILAKEACQRPAQQLLIRTATASIGLRCFRYRPDRAGSRWGVVRHARGRIAVRTAAWRNIVKGRIGHGIFGKYSRR